MNNVLTVLNVVLKTAVEWEMIDQLPCSIRLLPVARRDAAFHDFDAYECLLEAARSIDCRTYVIALLGGEGGMRAVRSSRWNGPTSTSNGDRSAFATPIGEAADDPQERQGPVRGDDGACGDSPSQASSPSQFTGAVPGRWQANHSAGRLVARSLYGAPVEGADRRSHPASHVLLAPGDAGCGNAGSTGTGGPSGSDDDPAVFAPESGGADRHHSVAGIENGRMRAWRNTGDG